MSDMSSFGEEFADEELEPLAWSALKDIVTFADLQEKADTNIVGFMSNLASKQASYFSTYGKYFQLLSTGGALINGTDTVFSVVSPSDEAHTGSIDYNWARNIPYSVEVHEWGGPQGFGYRAIFVMNYSGSLYTRQIDNGSNDTGWSLYQSG